MKKLNKLLIVFIAVLSLTLVISKNTYAKTLKMEHTPATVEQVDESKTKVRTNQFNHMAAIGAATAVLLFDMIKNKKDRY